MRITWCQRLSKLDARIHCIDLEDGRALYRDGHRFGQTFVLCFQSICVKHLKLPNCCRKHKPDSRSHDYNRSKQRGQHFYQREAELSFSACHNTHGVGNGFSATVFMTVWAASLPYPGTVYVSVSLAPSSEGLIEY